MRKRSLVAATLLLGVGAITAEGCGIFSSGECTDLALCPDQAGGEGGADGMADGTANGDGSGGPDVQLDTLVAPDGPLPDGTCNGGVEDCTNGLDDNCNTLVDCADPVCMAGYTCADAPPSGWSGPVSDWEAASGPPPGCAGAYATLALDGTGGFSASPATCGCTCPNPATGQQCQFASANYYTDGSCGTLCGSDALPPSFCVNFGSCGNGGSVSAPTFAPVNGSCTPNASKTVPPVAWGTTGRACNYSGKNDAPGGCASTAVCLAKPTAPFGGPCIYQGGDQTCPSDYPTKHLYYSGVNDTRDCAACGCNAPTGGNCTGSITMYTGASCTGTASNPFPLASGCQAVTPTNPYWSWTAGSYALTPGSCTPNGGGPIGSATATGPTTVCCK